MTDIAEDTSNIISANLMARLVRDNYDAFLREGFDEDQALDLSKELISSAMREVVKNSGA